MSADTSKLSAERITARDAAREQSWYHTIDLGEGVATPGAVDLRPVAPKVLPADLSGLRALDVGTFDGFWAFELGRRGARVVATDVDEFDAAEWPPSNRQRLLRTMRGTPGERFPLARTALGSTVERVPCAIYDLDAERLGGPFDYAVVGDLLIHLPEPVRGLESVRRVLKPGGRVLVLEQFNVPLTVLRPRAAAASFQPFAADYNWWEPNYRALREWLLVAGFEQPQRKLVYRLRSANRGQRRWHVAFEARQSRERGL